ncbi:Mitofusin FZO1 [Yarrowia sp. C11]|nr:Mitofusin FZO1 [Yarrowia sp. C11]
MSDRDPYDYAPGQEPGSSKDPDRSSNGNRDNYRRGSNDMDSGYAPSVSSSIITDDLVDKSKLIVFDGSTLEAAESSSQRRLSGETRQTMQAQLSQLRYNENRISLGRSISAVVGILRELQDVNRERPVYYPPVANSSPDPSTATSSRHNSPVPDLQAIQDPRNELLRNVSIFGEAPVVPDAPVSQNRRQSYIDGYDELPTVESEFNIFKLAIVDDSKAPKDVHEFDKEALGVLIDTRISKCMKHLSNLRVRIDDTASKVLITGDVNSGKSTFCNALLRRYLLPEDQQPCTNVFCEVIDARENENVEEVHAVPLGVEYNRNSEATYEVHKLGDLEDLVYEVDRYHILKIYTVDNRPTTQSLLHNGVIDISLIDAPGLNKDSYQTTQVFSRQEEIDLVIFVVSAENHFTLSAKEFITAAAREKSYVFIVVNRFDTIKNKQRCKQRILDQVKDLSPATHKDASEFVHFVSSSRQLEKSPAGPDDGPGDDDPDNNNPDMSDADFDALEESLRNFVLEKRSVSKLSPAKTYLTHILNDLEKLVHANKAVSQQQKDILLAQLKQITPQYDRSISDSTSASTQVDQTLEDCCKKAYYETREGLSAKFEQLATVSPAFSSYFDLYAYAEATMDKIVAQLQSAVIECEDKAKANVITAVDVINSVGAEKIGSEFMANKVFRHDLMFTRRKDTLSRAIKTDIYPSDFIDIQLPSMTDVITYDYTGKIKSLLGLENITKSETAQKMLSSESATAVSNALTLASVVGGSRLIVNRGWVHFMSNIIASEFGTVRKLILPVCVVTAVASLGYIIYDMPAAVPRNLARRVVTEVNSIDYIHSNSERIAQECRQVLKYPAREVRAGFDRLIEKNSRQRDECSKMAKKADVANKFFVKLEREIQSQKRALELIHVEVSALPLD